MKTIRSLVTLSLALGLTEAVLLTDSLRRGWALAYSDRDIRL
jgi:hypothetical protein